MDNVWDEVIELVSKSKCDKEDHPKVGAVIISSANRNVLFGGSHKEEGNRCKHAEEIVLTKLFNSLINKKNINPKNCEFFTSLEPCNIRGSFVVPCAHSVVQFKFKKVHIGMLDMNPTVYGRGLAYLITNLGFKNIYYAPKKKRDKIKIRNNVYREFQHNNFSFEKFKEEKLPLYTSVGIDIETYLHGAHALTGMFHGEKITMLFPKLPSFSDRHVFHTWWAQGVLENEGVKKIEFIMYSKDWNDAFQRLKNKPQEEIEIMKDTLLEEFSSVKNKKDITLKLVNNYNDNIYRCTLLWKDNKVDCIILNVYKNLGGNELCIIIACEPKHLGGFIGDFNKSNEILDSMIQIYQQYKNQGESFFPKLEECLNQVDNC